MAKPVSFTKTTEDGDILLDMVEPSFHSKSTETKGLYLKDAGSSKKIDYVLVYESCEEKENKDEEAKEEAMKHEEMRKAYENSLSDAGLIVERSECISSQVSADLSDPLRTLCS